ncbi:MAG: AsmA family protein, partial [Nitrospiraceae bacterium]
MTVRPRTLVLSLLAILLLVLVMASLPFLSDPDYAKKLILSQVERQIGRKIEVGQAHLEIIPKIRLELSQVVIRDLDPSRVFFRAKRMDLVLRMTPLLRLQVVGKRLKVEEPQVELRRDRAGLWNFLSGPGGETGSIQAEGNPLALLLRIRETTVTNGEITIVDEFRQDGVRSLQVRTLDAIMSTASRGLAVDVRLSATIPATLGVSSLSLVGKVTQADRSVRVAPDAPAGNVPGVQFEGVTEALNVDLRQVADFFGPRPVSEGMSGSANLLGRVRLAPGVVGYDMVLSDMTANVQRMSLKGQASLSGLMTAQPTFSLTFSSSPVDLGELLDRLPAEWLRPQLRTMVTEREIGGTIEVVTATVSGTTTPEPRVSMTGEFRVQQGHGLLGRERTPAQNVSGTVIVEPDRVRLTDLTGLYGSMRVSGGKATVSLTEPDPVVDLELAGDIAAADLVAKLAGIIRLEGIANGLAGLREIRGDTLLTFRLAGPLDRPGGLSFIGGEFVPRDVSFRTPLVPERIAGLNGRVIVSPERMEFDKLAGRMGQAQFEVQGIITAGAESTFRGLTVQVRGDAAQLLRMLPVGTVSSTALQGTIGATVSLSGLTGAPQFKVVVELKDTELTVAGVMRKPVGTPASLQVEGNLSRDSLLSADRIELTIPPVRLGGKGSMRLGKKFGVDAAFVSGPIDLAKLPPVIESGGIKAGTLEVSLDVKGKQRDWKTWQIKGWVAITDGQITTKDLGHPVKDLYVRLKLVRNGADLKSLAFRIKDSDVRLSGTVRNWHQTPAITLTAESTKLDFDLLLPKGARSPVRDFLETLASTSRLVATVRIDRGVYQQFTLTELTGRVNIRDGVLDVDRLNG